MNRKYEITFYNEDQHKEALIKELERRLPCIVKYYKFHTHRYIDVEVYLTSDIVFNSLLPMINIYYIEVSKRLIKGFLIPENFFCYKEFYGFDYRIKSKECRNCDGSGMEPIETW